MDDDLLLRALVGAVEEAFAEMLPDVPVERGESSSDHGLGDAAIVTISGDLCGSLAVQTPRDSTRLLARRIAGDLASDDDGKMADSGLLTELEQDSLRELSNRVGCIFTGVLSNPQKTLSPTFPIFVYGHDINIRADCDHDIGAAFVVDNEMPVQVRAFLGPPRSGADRSDQIRDLERLRDELLGDTGD